MKLTEGLLFRAFNPFATLRVKGITSRIARLFQQQALSETMQLKCAVFVIAFSVEEYSACSLQALAVHRRIRSSAPLLLEKRQHRTSLHFQERTHDRP